MFHSQWVVTPERQVVFHYERGQQDGGKRWDQLLGGDGNLIADLRNLMLDFGYLRYADFKPGPFDQMAVTLSFNKQREERVNQGGNGNPTGGITHQYERTAVWGTSFFLAKQMRRHHLLLGGDGYREKEVSPAFTVNPVSGVTAFSRPRLPDGARYLLYGLYLQDAWEVLKSGRLRFSGALRFGGASYRSRANALALWPDDSASTNAWSGRAGVVVRPIDPLHIHFHYSRGFRAPGMTDLGTLGIHGNGFFEASFADLGGRGATVGDRADERAVSSGRPAARVRAENSDNYDLGFKIATGRVRVEVTGFWMNLKNTIVSQTLILPPGVVGQFLGDQQIIRQLPTGAVFVPATTAPVQIRSNLGSAQTYGLEHALEIKLSRSLSFSENLTWLYARDLKSGLAPDIEGGTPPLTSNLRLRWAPSAKRYWGEVYSTLADQQDRLSSLALADRRAGATRSRANIASFFNNGARVRGLVVNGVLVPTGETLGQVQDRVLGTANAAPLFTAIPGYALFGVRGGFQVSERSNVLVDFSNMLDQGHRGVSWGVDGAGRSCAVRYRHSF
jgi:hemoglobin/transferrin/lactoferrin receptor protein